MNKHSRDIVFLHNDFMVVISMCKNETTEAFIDKALGMLEEVRQNIEKYLKFTVTIGVGSVCESPSKMYESYNDAISALDYRLLLGNNRVIYIGDVEPKQTERLVFDELKEHSLSSTIKIGTTNEIIEMLEGIFSEIIEAKASFKDYQVYLLEILTTILKVAKDLNVDMDNVFGANYNLFVEMYKFDDIDEVRDWTIGICTKIMGYISKDRQDTCSSLVKKAREYILEHYQESDMNIETLCKHLHISSTYFSTIFKKETKTTFVNYLTQVRMEQAKELLRTTNMKTLEIAERVGYSEPNYFSYCFKKNFGISPSEYRNSN